MLSTKFVSAQFSDGTFTDNNSLARALLIDPEIASTVIYSMGAGAAAGGKGDSYNLLQYLTTGTGRVGEYNKNYKVIGNEELQWALFGALMEAQVITGTVTPTSTPGVNFTEFTVPFSKKYFHVGDVCRFEDETLARVQTEPTKIGNNWCYKFVIDGANTAAFVSATAVEVGRYVTFDHTAFEEYSDGGGAFEATPMWFRNQMTISRAAKAYTGSAITNVTVLKFTRNGKTQNLWMPEAQFQFMRNQMRAHERQLFNGRYNRLADGSFGLFGTNGRPVVTGSGIEEQLSGANTYSVPSLTEDLFWQIITDTSDASNGAENQHKFLVTGNGGMYEFQKLGDKFLSRMQVVADPDFFVSKLTGNKLAFGHQWTTYKGPSGGTFTVVNHPMFNDKSVFAATTGSKGYTRQSYKMFFLDASDYDLGDGRGTTNNLTMITKGADGINRQLRMWHTDGAESPNSSSDGSSLSTTSFGPMRSHGLDGYKQYILQHTGCAIYNPTACGVIRITPLGN
jgi:hypothetical protein